MRPNLLFVEVTVIFLWAGDTAKRLNSGHSVKNNVAQISVLETTAGRGGLSK